VRSYGCQDPDFSAFRLCAAIARMRRRPRRHASWRLSADMLVLALLVAPNAAAPTDRATCVLLGVKPRVHQDHRVRVGDRTLGAAVMQVVCRRALIRINAPTAGASMTTVLTPIRVAPRYVRCSRMELAPLVRNSQNLPTVSKSSDSAANPTGGGSHPRRVLRAIPPCRCAVPPSSW
jgi:hypothetical protein